MTPFRNILVATDFGEPSSRAVDAAIDLATAFEANLVLFHANWFPPVAYAAYAEGLCWPTNDMLEQDAKTFDATVAKVKLRYPRCEGSLVSAEPAAAIVEAAKRGDVDFIVLGTHGRHGLARVVLGSVAELVVRLSPVPVLTIPAKKPEETGAPGETRP